MSIASEITRIQTAKENIRTSIINKGGTLSSDAPIDEYASAISSIPTSGGGSSTLTTKNITVNGTYTASDDNADGYSSVTVNVQNQGTLIYEGTFSEDTGTFAVTTLPNGDSFSFDKIIIELTNMGQGYNSGWRQYWRKELPMTGNTTYMINNGVGYLANATALKTISIMEIEDASYITLKSFGYDVNAPTTTKASYSRVLYDTYDKITAYGWWSWSCPTGTHIKITGYNN